MLVLALDDALVQGWSVDDLEPGKGTLPIAAKTLETCLVRSNVPDYEPTDGEDLSTTAAALLAEMPTRFGFVIETTSSGTGFSGTQTYSTLEDRQLFAAITEDINGASNGPEWRITLRWADDHTRVVKVIEVKPRVGVDRPEAVFDLDANGEGTIETYTRPESFAAGKGATLLIGTGDGTGGERAMSTPMLSDRAATQGFPVWEERPNFTGLGATDVDEDTELDNRTRDTLAQRELGASNWTITTREYGPMPGRDYDLGDTGRIDVAPQGYDTLSSDGTPRRVVLDPTGGKASPRFLGFSLDLATLVAQPELWDDDDQTGDS
jgi:hypothetical protein